MTVKFTMLELAIGREMGLPKPKEVAAAIVFLCLPESRHIWDRAIHASARGSD
jgi:hypothetical protein